MRRGLCACWLPLSVVQVLGGGCWMGWLSFKAMGRAFRTVHVRGTNTMCTCMRWIGCRAWPWELGVECVRACVLLAAMVVVVCQMDGTADERKTLASELSNGHVRHHIIAQTAFAHPSQRGGKKHNKRGGGRGVRESAHQHAQGFPADTCWICAEWRPVRGADMFRHQTLGVATPRAVWCMPL